MCHAILISNFREIQLIKLNLKRSSSSRAAFESLRLTFECVNTNSTSLQVKQNFSQHSTLFHFLSSNIYKISKSFNIISFGGASGGIE